MGSQNATPGSGTSAVRLQVGNLDQKVDELAGAVQALGEKMDRNQAQIIELLSGLVGKNPNS
ncbi:hypothetical protein [Streptomyces niveus]|uniref:hypothetical protein n=1 Tax=Streptomyces niveus TaxID=193462 RepID=UPI0036D283BB